MTPSFTIRHQYQCGRAPYSVSKTAYLLPLRLVSEEPVSVRVITGRSLGEQHFMLHGLSILSIFPQKLERDFINKAKYCPAGLPPVIPTLTVPLLAAQAASALA